MFGCAIFLDIYYEYDKRTELFFIAFNNLNTMNSDKIMHVCTVFSYQSLYLVSNQKFRQRAFRGEIKKTCNFVIFLLAPLLLTFKCEKTNCLESAIFHTSCGPKEMHLAGNKLL